jgi:hypothetical protein
MRTRQRDHRTQWGNHPRAGGCSDDPEPDGLKFGAFDLYCGVICPETKDERNSAMQKLKTTL